MSPQFRGGILKHSSPGPRQIRAVDVADIAYLVVQDATAESSVFDRSQFDRLANFQSDSFGVGNLLGEGIYCNVNEIQKTVSNSTPVSAGNSGDGNDTAQNYVVKIVKPAIKTQPECFEEAILDLAREACFLSSCDHPNIIQIHGTYFGCDEALCDTKASDCFIVLERLHETLEHRMIEWSNQERKASKLLRHPKKDRARLIERLKDARAIASAMKYLHDRRIIFRDLKSSNVGYDSFGTVKIFDFGLAREVPESVQIVKEVFNMSSTSESNLDSHRYLAPECIKCQPYNLTADVYSFGVLLWEMCTLKRAYDGYDKFMMHFNVACGKKRPEMTDSLPFRIRNLISRCWSDDTNVRPSFDLIENKLGEIVFELEEEQKRLTEKKEKSPLPSKIFHFELRGKPRHEKPRHAAARGA